MRKIYVSLIFVFVILMTSQAFSLANISSAKEVSQDASYEKAISEARYSGGLKIPLKSPSGRKSLGVGLSSDGEIALTFARAIGNTDYDFGAFVGYKSKQKVFLEDFDSVPNSRIANIEMSELSRTRVFADVSRVLHVTSNKYWGFVVGLGAGVSSGVYEISYYKPKCYLICGYDPKPFAVRFPRENYLFLATKLGLTFREVEMWGSRGDYSFSIRPEIGRWPESADFKAPDGRVYPPMRMSGLLVEGAITF